MRMAKRLMSVCLVLSLIGCALLFLYLLVTAQNPLAVLVAFLLPILLLVISVMGAYSVSLYLHSYAEMLEKVDEIHAAMFRDEDASE